MMNTSFFSKSKFFLLAACVAVASIGQLQAQKKVVADKNVQVRPVEEFHSISVGGSANIYFSQSSEFALATSADNEGDLNYIKTIVKNGVLHISFDNHPAVWKGKKNFRIYVSAPELRELTLSGAANFNIEGVLKQTAAKMTLSGAVNLKGKVDLQSLSLTLSGASDAVLSGSVEQGSFSLSGASDFKSYGLQVNNAVISSSGACDVHLTINKTLTASLSGACDLYYKGSPEVKDSKTSGAAKIQKRG
jgi:hypothetical protein